MGWTAASHLKTNADMLFPQFPLPAIMQVPCLQLADVRAYSASCVCVGVPCHVKWAYCQYAEHTPRASG